MEEKVKEAKNIPRFSKEQFLKSKTIGISYDILDTLLESGRQYSIDEVRKAVEAFKKRKVK